MHKKDFKRLTQKTKQKKREGFFYALSLPPAAQVSQWYKAQGIFPCRSIFLCRSLCRWFVPLACVASCVHSVCSLWLSLCMFLTAQCTSTAA